MPAGEVFEITYRGNYGGVNVAAPENIIPATDTPFVDNFIFRNRELRTRPKLRSHIPGLLNNVPFGGLTSFLDSNNVVHTVGFAQTGVFQLNSNWPNVVSFGEPAWNQIGPFDDQDKVPNNPWAIVNSVNRLYFTNGSSRIYQWDGISNTIVTTTSICGGTFLVELDAHLLCLATTENVSGVVTNYPARVRWSQSANFAQFDPAVNPGAGFNDMLDVPDSITGIMTIGRVGFVFRANGITELVPVNRGTAPFDFNHLWASDRGIGNIYAQSIANYGSVGIFISTDEIYQMGISSFEEIGRNSLNAIMDDLAEAGPNVFAAIVPQWIKNFIYLVYLLTIQKSDGTSVIWMYAIRDKNWTRFTSKRGFPTAKFRHVISR